MRSHVILLAIFVAAPPHPAWAAESKETQASEPALGKDQIFWERGMQFIKQQDCDAARAQFAEIQRLFPGSPYIVPSKEAQAQCDADRARRLAEDDVPSNADEFNRNYGKRLVVIVQSTQDYPTARKTAEQAAKKLGSVMDLRELTPTPALGLTLPKDQCPEKYPCYYARERNHEEPGHPNDLVSVEYSTAYQGFRPGFYIVVTALGTTDDRNAMHAALAKAKKFYPDAYMKETTVYKGCMH